MTLRNEKELTNTKRKLADLEKIIAQSRANAASGTSAEIRSLTRLANQLREEIARYEAAFTSTRTR